MFMKLLIPAALLMSIFAMTAEATQKTAVSTTQLNQNAACTEAQFAARHAGGTNLQECKCHGGGSAWVCTVEFTVTP
jgi:uncharacterized cupredoxin-like copper-binding protein